MQLPPIPVREVALHEGASGEWLHVVDLAPRGHSEMPPDFYLREAMEVDPADIADVMGFVSRWGVPVDPQNRDIRQSSDLERWARESFTLADENTLEEGRAIAAVELGLIPAERLSLRLVERPELYHERKVAIARAINLAEVTTRLHRMIAFCQVVIGSAQSTVDEFSDLNAALATFAPAVVPRRYAKALIPEPTVYTVCALQIANDVLDGANFHTCQNETCGRTFTKQRGRAQYNAHRTLGVMYCTKECAKAQAQRELRRRRREEAQK